MGHSLHDMKEAGYGDSDEREDLRMRANTLKYFLADKPLSDFTASQLPLLMKLYTDIDSLNLFDIMKLENR